MEDRKFTMTEPKENRSNRDSKYSFWLTTDNNDLFDFVAALVCVENLRKLGQRRALVAIKDEYDADEAWHYIRTELEDEAHVIELDAIWENAMRWL